jgi:hypothetical protein
MLAVLVGVGAAAFCWGRSQSADANPPVNNNGPGRPGAGYSDKMRIVAYLYGTTVPVSREELGEYLIARFGAERLEFMVNRKIVEVEASKRNIFVTDAEVEARFQRDLQAFGNRMTEQDFVNSVLRRFNKSLYEWKEDVIRPKLMMEKIVAPLVTVTEKDLRDGFEARHGPKRECRMIVIDPKDTTAQKTWEEVTKGGAPAFLSAATKQFIPNLASTAGKVPPIHMHFGDALLEKTAFRLKEGEISELLEMPDKSRVILMCEKHHAGNAIIRFEDERGKLIDEMNGLRLAQMIPEEFKKMRDLARPNLALQPDRPQRMASVQPPPPQDPRSVEMPPPPKTIDPPSAPIGPPSAPIGPPPPLPQPVSAQPQPLAPSQTLPQPAPVSPQPSVPNNPAPLAPPPALSLPSTSVVPQTPGGAR